MLIVGQQVELQLAIRNDKGADADPTTLVLQIMDPSGVVTQFSVGSGITKTDVGDYVFLLTLALAGVYKWRWHGTGGGAEGATEGQLTVKASLFPSPA